MRLSFVGITPDTRSQCPAVYVDEDTGDIWFQGETVTDPERWRRSPGTARSARASGGEAAGGDGADRHGGGQWNV